MNFLVGHHWQHRHELAREAEAFAEALLCLELGNAPAYVVLSSELPGNLASTPNCLGFAAPSLDVCLRPMLGDRWQGPGLAVVVNDQAIEAQFPPDTSVSATGRQRALLTTFASVLVHELAHGVAFLAKGNEPARRAAAEQLLARGESLDWLLAGTVEGVAAYSTSRVEGTCTDPPWNAHELGFVRSHAHLVHRAAKLGLVLDSWEQHAAGQQYALSPVQSYAHALAGEVRERERESLISILADDPPLESLELFNADVAAWEASR